MGGSKTYKITDFNISEKRKQFYRDLDKSRMAMGNEKGEGGRDHLQIFITFKRSYGFKSMKKLLGGGGEAPHFEVALVTDWNYELKEMSYEIDDRRTQGKRSDLKLAYDILTKGGNMRDITKEVKCFNSQCFRTAEIWLKYNEPVREITKHKIICYWGKTGVGKTKEVFDNFGTDVFIPLSYKWWEGYDAHKIVLIDDFRGDWCKFNELLRLTDLYPLRVETKGGSRQMLATTIIFTAPLHPKDWYDNEDYLGRPRDLNQLIRRFTEIKEIKQLGTEVGEGNTILPQPEPKTKEPHTHQEIKEMLIKKFPFKP